MCNEIIIKKVIKNYYKRSINLKLTDNTILIGRKLNRKGIEMDRNEYSEKSEKKCNRITSHDRR